MLCQEKYSGKLQVFSLTPVCCGEIAENQNTEKKSCGTAAGKCLEFPWTETPDVFLDADQDVR